MCKHHWRHLSLIQTCFEGESCWVCHGRFHSILPKEYPGTFWELPWGLYKEMPTNTQGQSDIVSHQTNIWNKVYRVKWTFYYTATVMNLATPKAAAKREPLFSKPASAARGPRILENVFHRPSLLGVVYIRLDIHLFVNKSREGGSHRHI